MLVKLEYFSVQIISRKICTFLQLPTIATILGVVGVGSLVYRAQQDYLTGLEAKMTNLETSANNIESSITSLAESISTLSSTVSSLSSSSSSSSTYVTSICTQVRFHSSEIIRGLCLMKLSRQILQNLPYFWNKKTQKVFFSILSNFGFLRMLKIQSCSK